MDFFSAIAPFYERLIPLSDLSVLRKLLDLPCSGPLLDLGGGTGRISSQFGNEVEKVLLVDRALAKVRRAKSKQGSILWWRTQRAFQFVPVYALAHWWWRRCTTSLIKRRQWLSW